MNRLKLATTIGLGFLLSGCFEGRKNTEQLCAENPALRCELLNMDDGQCRVPRTDLVWHRFEVLKDPSDINKIREYHILAEYEKCLTLAAQIQPIDQNNRKEKRFTSQMHVNDEQARVVSELKLSTSPQALYFLWSQEGDEQARRGFLQMEGSQALESAEMQYALATFYTSRDAEKTLYLLNRSLELADGKKTNIDAVKSLASINFQQNRKELAYIWAQVANQFDVQTASVSNRQLMYGFSAEKYEQLDNIAESVYDAIGDGAYRTTLIPQF
ncbi:hypothetical protein VIBRN418_15088 [Vibrio sp. N418]|uniref:DUF2989 domain-containing protein n=1 Tax=Vibrio sp. (strain N418) TaxID=701176 RepID=UPI00021BEC87|nr:DUF2989 domain-containing protein [Vibrio sp. N418]EGU36255.1 hypothetical protein VIBRN418_15088 [Vibrio sp. N418]